MKVVLPKRINAVVGNQLQLFYRGMIGAVNPYVYDILVQCNRGKQYPRYFDFTPTSDDVGDIPFAITIKDNNGNVLGQAETVIHVVEPVLTSDLHILTFGDSLTSGGVWCNYADRHLPEDALFCGAQEVDGTHFFGVGGWTWLTYISSPTPRVRMEVSGVTVIHKGDVYADSDGTRYTVQETNITSGRGNLLMSVASINDHPSTPQGSLNLIEGKGDSQIFFDSWRKEISNPLWADGKMTFKPYVEKYAGGRADVVYVLLGWNQLVPWMTDFSAILSQANQFCSTFLSEYSEGRIRIMGLQIPSVTGGIGASYGASGQGYADGYGLRISVLELNRIYQSLADMLGDRVEFIDIACQFDSEYNMPSGETPVNKFNPQTEYLGTNGVHPNIYGYYQIGDAVVRDIYNLSRQVSTTKESPN